MVWVQRILGHTSAGTALRRYSHWVQPEQEDAKDGQASRLFRSAYLR